MKAKFITIIILLAIITLGITSCEKEIQIEVKSGTEQLVVEASINQFSPILNYVFITKSLDYFKPDLTLGGVDQALVTVTAGRIDGTDTIYDGTQTRFFNIYDIPGADTLYTGIGIDSITRNLRGIYVNPFFTGTPGVPYKLEITLSSGKQVTGTTVIPQPVPIDTVKYELRGEPDDSGRVDAFVSFFWNDPQERNNYRVFLKSQFTSLLLGWGAADRTYTFDDEFANGIYRSFNMFRPFKQRDTLNIFLTTVGRKEFFFWQSYERANNGANPFSTPVVLKSNINGAIGTFTGYGVAFRQVILN
jgi:hypothetical protein